MHRRDAIAEPPKSGSPLTIKSTMRFRKEIQIFKEVYQHSLFGDHVQEVREADYQAVRHVTPSHIASRCMCLLRRRFMVHPFLLPSSYINIYEGAHAS